MATLQQTLSEANRVLAIGGVDADGYYGKQCMDLIVHLMSKEFGWRPTGNAIALTYQALPAGFQRIKNTPDFLPLPGDIAIWGYNEFATYGHTGFIVSANMNTFQSIDQNWFTPSLTVGSPAALVNHNYYGFWGVIRPPYQKEEDEMPIKDKDNEYWRWNKLGKQIRGRSLTRAEFKKSAVGQNWLRAMEILSDDKEADTATQWQDVGKLAVNDKWQTQIGDLKKSNTSLSAENKDLKAKLAVQSNDTVGLNKLGEALAWFLKRIGTTK